MYFWFSWFSDRKTKAIVIAEEDGYEDIEQHLRPVVYRQLPNNRESQMTIYTDLIPNGGENRYSLTPTTR